MIRRRWARLSFALADWWFMHHSRSRVARLTRAEQRRFRATLTEGDRRTLARLVAGRSARGRSARGVVPVERELLMRLLGYETSHADD